MPRIQPVTPEEAVGSSKQIFDDFMKQRGNIPNMFRTLAHRPEYLATIIAHFKTILNTGTVDLRTKELLAVRVSQLNECHY